VPIVAIAALCIGLAASTVAWAGEKARYTSDAVTGASVTE
jgi:hypothetical protein